MTERRELQNENDFSFNEPYHIEPWFSPLTTCKLTETASNLSGWHSYWPLWLESTLAKIAKDSKVNNFFLFLLEKSLELSESGTICQSSDNGVPSRYLKKASSCKCHFVSIPSSSLLDNAHPMHRMDGFYPKENMYTSFSVIFESVKLKRFSKKKQYQNNDDNHHFWHVYLSFDQSCPPYIRGRFM